MVMIAAPSLPGSSTFWVFFLNTSYPLSLDKDLIRDGW
jgi:hypothetical protein